MIIIMNSFSLSVLEFDVSVRIKVTKISDAQARQLVQNNDYYSTIGHEDAAQTLTDKLGVPVAFNRIKRKLDKNDLGLVAQYIGPRLPEGVTRLPDGSKIEFRLVEII